MSFQYARNFPLRNHRPAEALDVHVKLIHPIFDKFQQLSQSISVKGLDCDFTVDFCGMMSYGYELEAERETNLCMFLSDYIGRTIIKCGFSGITIANDIRNDGGIVSRHGELVLIVQGRSELGLGGRCPVIQHAAFMAQYYLANPALESK
jgi:hypothetical protein